LLHGFGSEEYIYIIQREDSGTGVWFVLKQRYTEWSVFGGLTASAGNH